MNKRFKTIFIIGLIVIAVSALGWGLGHSGKSTNNSPEPASTSRATDRSVKDLVTYTIPDAWNENACPASSKTIYIIPNGTVLDCSISPSAPIKIYVDSQNTTDCQLLMPATSEGIRKHICISLYISGHKSLKASTEYSSGSGYKIDTTISDYYINTGKGVVGIQYTHTSTNDFQAGFDQLATSIKVK